MKTEVKALEASQDILVTRQFDLPVDLLFKAYTDPVLFEKWMGTKVLKLESKVHGSYAFETSHEGNVVFRAHGTIHAFEPNLKIIRTFEMEGFPVQLEFLDFISLSPERSMLRIHMVFKSVEFRNQLLQMPFAQGLSMAHDRLQEIVLA
jgi:uncharacterized protein YndB with AHSA1/START domain